MAAPPASRRARGKVLLPIVSALAVLACACGSGSGPARPTNLERPGPPASVPYTPYEPPSTEPPEPPETPPSPTAEPTATTTPTRPQPTCPSRALLGVYDPDRLHVLARCVTFRGVVERLVSLPDGDMRFDILPAPGYGRFLNDANRSALGGRLEAVIIRGQPMQLFRPQVGEHIVVLGTFVRDLEHGWNAMHPVWQVRYVESGTTIYATPPDPPLHDRGG